MAETTCPDYFGIALEKSNKGDSFGKRIDTDLLSILLFLSNIF